MSFSTDGGPNTFPYHGPGRSGDYERYHGSYYRNQITPEAYESSQNQRHSTSHDTSEEVSSTSHSPEFKSYEMPSTEDVKTIAYQMRTMPNYFAAMAAAASLNVNYPSLVTENEPEYPSPALREQQVRPSIQSKYYDDRYSNNTSIVTPKRNSLPGERRENELPRSHLDMSSDLHEMVNVLFLFVVSNMAQKNIRNI